ncbi:hypothetical protein AQUCO_01000500v1 [Aquilegia coerulea]|uniref:Maf-like protein n=1 Tax=Aquilegia coerulea TaxID=218851 RepID=A0A2G5EAA8_AQUCA|nr:hypothetical protein AQUCO_01000500v1 [Aquilegia coerulea]
MLSSSARLCCCRLATPLGSQFLSPISFSLSSHSFPPNQNKRKSIISNMSTSTSNSNSPPFKIILGSSSQARRNILKEMGYEFKIMTADIDEKGIRMEKPEELVMALAEAKANAIASMLQNTDLQDQDDKCTLLLTADTVVVYDGVIREKPSSKEEAREFIKGYSGGHAATVGSVLVTNLKTGTRKGGWDKVEIYFHEIPDEVIDNLIEEGVVLYVAGGLIIEHPSVLPLVKQVVGTTDSVMGLPKALTEKLIREAL